MSVAVANAKLTYGHAVRSELLKVTTMRSMWWIVVVSVAMAVFIIATSSEPPPEPGTEAEWTAVTSAKGILLPWVILAVYSALQATGEWSSGMYRVSFAVVPRRNLWLAAKATALGIFVGAVSIVVMVASVIATFIKFGGDGATMDFAVGHTWQIFIGVPAVCVMTAIMAVGIGALVRSSGIAVTSVVALLVVLPFAGLFQLQWLAHITAYLPSGAGDSVIGASSFGVAPDDIGPVFGTVVMLAWSVGSCVAAAISLNRRDA